MIWLTSRISGGKLISAQGIGAPLLQPVFRKIWLASLLSNLGLLIQGVGAAWAMTLLTPSADMVALVQTASMLPIMLLAIPAGAIADMYDRRKVLLAALWLSLAGASALSVMSWAGFATPAVLLIFCFVIGSGMALFGPAWQASVSEQVPAATLPAAIALNSISYNIARSFGPAIGGIIVSAAGALSAFVVNALLYIPLLIVLYRWQRERIASRLPPERLRRAIVSGARYVMHSPSIRVVLARTFLTALAGSSLFALMPLVARNLLGGGPQIFGIMLGAFGMGAVVGALNVGAIRNRFGVQASALICALALGAATAAVALSRNPFLTAFALVIAGVAWIVMVALFNISVQLSAPRWVAGRALASFQASTAGGVAVGSWIWGHAAQAYGVEASLLLSCAAILTTPVIGMWLKLPAIGGPNDDATEAIADPEVRLQLTARSGPIVVEIEYRVDTRRAREFHTLMQDVQAARQRNGAYGWSIARELGDPEMWVERYHCPTWHDYLRQRSRPTKVERALLQSALDFHLGPEPVRIHRMLERPFGSVRWKDESPDGAEMDDLTVTAQTGGGH